MSRSEPRTSVHSSNGKPINVTVPRRVFNALGYEEVGTVGSECQVPCRQSVSVLSSHV